MSCTTLVASVATMGQIGSALQLVPYSIIDYFATAGEGTVVRYAGQQSSTPT